MVRKGPNRLAASARFALLGMTALTAPAFAWGDGRAIAFDFQNTPEYGRIIVTWDGSEADAPRMTTSMVGPVLILKFREPVSFDPEELPEGLPSRIAVARLSEDGKEARIALAGEYRIHQSYSFDLAGIDLVEPAITTDPPDIVSPIAEKRRLEAEAAAAAAEAARLAALPEPSDVQVRASEGNDFSTLAFYWPQAVDFVAADEDGALELTFSKRGIADLAPVRVAPPTGMMTIDDRNTDENWIVRLGLQDGYWASPIKVDDAVLVRFRRGEKPEEPVAEDTLLPAALQVLADELPEIEMPPPSRKPHANMPDHLADEVEPAAELTAPAGVETPEEEIAAPVAEPVELEPITPRRLWNEALDRSGNAQVLTTPHGSGLELEIDFQSDIPGAVFRRHGAIWIAFPASGQFEFDADSVRSGFRIDPIEGEAGMALRVFASDNQIASVQESGETWTVKIGGKGELANVRLHPKRMASSGGSGILVDVPEAGTLFDLDDPDVGQTLTILPVKSHTTSLEQPLSFVEASFPSTINGLVIVPRADDLSVIQRDEQVMISRDSGLALSSWGVETGLPMTENLSPAFMDFVNWRRGDKGDFWRNHGMLDRAAAIADPTDWTGQSSLLDLARFYLGWSLAPEAYGPLNMAADADPLLREDAQWLALKGAADVMNGRYDEALESLERSPVRSDASAAAWRGLAQAHLGEWRKAREEFLTAEPMIDAYEPIWAGRFHAAAARANIRMGDGGKAERHATAARRVGDKSTRGHAGITLGELALATDRKQDAATIFSRLLDHEDANVRVRAELASILLAREQGEMSALDASDRLDSLRFRWRGDALELEIVSALVDVLFELGQFREALNLSQFVSMQFPKLAGARDLRIKMMDQFEALYLDGRADEMDPIIALALFYEFKDLTPIGPDGDRMIRRLANRLVSFDLLDPATELLAHQVDNRNLIGASRAKIAADLAAIYLLDERAEDALRTIASTRQTGLSDELRLERRLLEAAAHMELNRFGHAIELLENLNDQRALDLLAEVHWRSRTWGAAGRALQRTLPDPGAELSSLQAQTAVRSAVAYRMDGDFGGLADLRQNYGTAMQKTREADTFDLLTGTNQVSSARLTDTVRQLADTTSADAFIRNLKQRFGEAGGMP